MVDELFSKRLLVTVKAPDREDRKTHIDIAVEVNTTSTPVHRKELVIRLTDEKDLFFLYTLKLAEEDFQSLKSQQGLLVDFGAFPQKFIDLLDLSFQEEHKEFPKFILELSSNGTSGSSTANLNIIETNPFKHLTHLSLKFLPGVDADIKKYLAGCLKNLKEQNQTLLHKFEHTEADLSQQLRQTREALAARSFELDNLKAAGASKTNELEAKHSQMVTAEREKALQTQTSLQQRQERERRELEQAHMKIVKQMEAKIYSLESSNKELTDRRYKNESNIRELKGQLSALEDENHRAKQDLQAVRSNHAGLDSDYNEQQRLASQMKTRLAVLEQELKDKETVLTKSTDLARTEQEQKRKIEEDYERQKRHVGKLEISVRKMAEEIAKANEIIKKLQGEIRNYNKKIKLRQQTIVEQEKLLGGKSQELEEKRKEMQSIQLSLQQKEIETQKLTETLDNTQKRLEESKQLLKTNENVINWLNKQVTETQLGQQRHGMFEMNSAAPVSGATFRPQHDYGASVGSVYGQPSRLSTTVSSVNTQISTAASRHPHQPQVQYNAGAMRKTSSMPIPLAKSSPINTIPEERPGSQSTGASPAHLSSQTKTQTNDPLLDAKYLQRTSEPPARGGADHRPISPTSIHFSRNPTVSVSSQPATHLNQPTSMAGSAPIPTRLNRDVIVPKTTNVRPSSQTSLAHAYFPSHAKVT